MKKRLLLIYLLLSSCSSPRVKKTDTVLSPPIEVSGLPSSEAPSGCADLFATSLREGHNLDSAAWERETLQDSGTIDSKDFETFMNSASWQKVIEQGGSKAPEEQLMAFTILSILKKRFPEASEQNLRERFLVLMQFCG